MVMPTEAGYLSASWSRRPASAVEVDLAAVFGNSAVSRLPISSAWGEPESAVAGLSRPAMDRRTWPVGGVRADGELHRSRGAVAL